MAKALCLALLLLLLSGCAAVPSSVVCSCAAPVLGIFTDETLTVTVVQPYRPADAANVQVGDKLIDLRPAKPEPGISSEPVPFTDRDAANELIWYTVPSLVPVRCCGGERLWLVLRVERAGEIVELDISSGYGLPWPPAPAQQGSPLTSPPPTPTVTPTPRDWLYF